MNLKIDFEKEIITSIEKYLGIKNLAYSKVEIKLDIDELPKIILGGILISKES